MNELDLVTLMIPTVLPVAFGWVIVRMNLLTAGDSSVLSTLFLHVCGPALILVHLAKEEFESLISPPYIFATLTLMLGLYGALLVVHRVFLKRGLEVSAFAAFTGTKFNAVVVGFPVLLATIGHHAGIAVTVNGLIGYFSILPLTILLCNAGRTSNTEKAVPFGLFLFSMKKVVTNPLVMATVLGVSLAGLKFRMPAWLDTALLTLGEGALAMALIAVGMSLNALSFKKSGADIVWMSAVRVVLSPALAIVVAKSFGLSPIFAIALVISFSLPTAKMVFPLAQENGVYVEEAAGVIAASTASLIIVWPVSIWICERLWPGVIMAAR